MAGKALSLQGWALAKGLHWQTMVFSVMCLSKMGHVLAIRSQRQSFFSSGIFSNKPLIAAVASAFLLQLMVTYVPFFQPIFKTEGLTMNEFALVAGASCLVFVAVEFEKVIFRKAHNIKHRKQEAD